MRDGKGDRQRWRGAAGKGDDETKGVGLGWQTEQRGKLSGRVGEVVGWGRGSGKASGREGCSFRGWVASGGAT